MLLGHLFSQDSGVKWGEVARELSSHLTSCSGADGSGCAWAWVLGGLGGAGVVGVGVCSGDGHRIGAGLISCPCGGVRVEEIQNVSSHITSKFISLLSPCWESRVN